MKLRYFLILLLMSAPFLGNAQLKGIMNKVKNKVNQQVDKKVDNEIDKVFNKTDGKEQAPAQPAKSSAPVENNNEPADESNSLKSFSKFDFIPGDLILYAEDFLQDEIGELPLNWNTGGKAELVTLNTIPGRWLRLYQNALYLTSNKTEFTKNFTVEFDLILQLKNGGYSYPYVSFGFLSSNDQPTNDNQFLNGYRRFQSTEFFVRPSEGGNSNMYLDSYQDGKPIFKSEQQYVSKLEQYYGKPAHFAIQVQEKRIRIWVNDEKKFDLPMAGATAYAFNNLFFKIHTSGYKDDQLGFYIGNLKVATGKPDARHKLVTEGKFTTTGILFDFQSAVIRPESYGVLKEIATVLKENSSIKIKIIGHTSSDGDDAANMELSKQRAAAVKDALTNEFDIDGSQLETEGKGETLPIADNKTKEGKALNRRVEFVKQ